MRTRRHSKKFLMLNMEHTLVMLKPDAINRAIVGELIHRFERKGLKIVGLKFIHLDDKTLDVHYAHHKGKAFFEELKRFMKSAPSAVVVLEGKNAVEVVRIMAGQTYGYEATPGTIRGDYSLSGAANIIHASDSAESADIEIKRFFKPAELFDWNRVDIDYLYTSDERA